MEITRKNKEAARKRKKRIFIIFISSLLFLFAAWMILDRWSKKHGFNGAGDFVNTVSSNYLEGLNANFESIDMTISESDFNKLEKQRNQHLENGIITKLNDRYVPAIITREGKKIKCKVRLKGHMTDHLQDQKWSFRVKTVGGDSFSGMRIFSLMHPGTRNYIYEWIYHQLLNEEGIATVRYSFLKLKVNGTDWGIYAVEENFASELVNHSRLPQGPILGFNPDLYWYARLNEHEKNKIELEDLSIYSSYAEAYDEGENFSSKENIRNYRAALILMEKFKRGELKTSQVFDIDKLARFHAILDLVGGQFSMDWSDVKYYYNPIVKKIEPVGYESFSVRNTSELSGESKYVSAYSGNLEWHEYLFSDAEFFKLYIHHLNRISKESYLNSFFSKIKGSLKNNLAILYSEFPYKKLSLDQYFKNQKNIIAIINKPILPLVSSIKNSNDSLCIVFGSNGTLPLQVHSIIFKNKNIKLESPLIISARKKNSHIIFEKYKIKISDTISKKDLGNMEIEVSWLGDTRKEKVKVKPIDLETDWDVVYQGVSNINEFDFVEINESSKNIFFKSGKHVLVKSLIIPSGYKVNFGLPFELDLQRGASIISHSPIKMVGTDELPILIYSSDSLGGGIELIQTKEKSYINFACFSNLGNVKKDKNELMGNSALLCYESDLEMKNNIFTSNSKLGFTIYRSKINIQNISFYQTEKSVEAFFSDVSITNCRFINSKDICIDLNSSVGSLRNSKFMKSGTGVKLDNGSFFNLNSITLEKLDEGIHLTDMSAARANNLTLKKVKIGFIARKKSQNFGASFLQVKGLKKEEVDKISSFDKNSLIKIQ